MLRLKIWIRIRLESGLGLRLTVGGKIRFRSLKRFIYHGIITLHSLLGKCFMLRLRIWIRIRLESGLGLRLTVGGKIRFRS